MRRFSITDKLVIASLLISVITILIVASFSFYNAKNAVLERSFNQLNSVRTFKTNLIESFFSNCIHDVYLAKSSNDILLFVNDLYNKREQSCFSDATKKNRFIKELLKQKYSNIYIVGKDDKVYDVKNSTVLNINKSIKTLIIKLSNKPFYINDYQDINNKKISIISSIKNNANKKGAYIIFEVSDNAINSIMFNNNLFSGLGKSGESYLVGSDYLMRSSSRFQKNSLLNTLVKTNAAELAFKNIQGNSLIKDYRGIKVLSSYSKISIPNLNWAIIAEIDYNEVTIPIYKIRNEIVFISIFIFFIVLVLVIILSRKITFPIQKLNHSVHEIGIGNFDVKIKNKTNDEIGELIETFNLMVEKLKQQSVELDLERKKSLRSLIDGQEAERQRLSRELHDSLGQLLIGLKLKFESFINKQKITNNELGKLFDKTIDETRRISNNLMPAVLSEFGLIPAIKNICNEINEISSTFITLKINGSSKEITLETKIYLFRIIQEALTNILKHSEASKGEIFINFTEKKIVVNISDNGIGFEMSNKKRKNSNGLNNIYDRVSLLYGNVLINSKLEGGTNISIEIPRKFKDER